MLKRKSLADTNMFESLCFGYFYRNGHPSFKLLYPINLLSTLWLFNIAMENGPFVDGLPINSMVIFHGYGSHNQMV